MNKANKRGKENSNVSKSIGNRHYIHGTAHISELYT